jgi:hypothetical protein
MTRISESSNPPIACTLSPEDLARRQQVIRELFQKTLEQHELEDGLHFTFPGSNAILAEILEFITFERKCCQFLSFELLFDAANGPIHLRLRGREDAKEAIRQIFA